MRKNEHLQTFFRMAKLANYLAKQVNGYERGLAYRLKADAISVLIMAGWATPNGAPINGIVGLDIFGDPPSRLHIPLLHLKPDARKRVRDHADLTGLQPQVERYQ